MSQRVATSVVLAAAVALGLGGCTQTEQQRRINDITVVRNEREPGRLQSRGDAAAVLGDLTRAEQYFTAALAAGGDERQLTRRLLVVCSLDERYPAAAAHAEDYLRKHPGDTETRYALATVYVAMGDSVKALAELRRVVAERPGIADAHYALATMLRQQGVSLMDADTHFREYIRLLPDGPYAEAARASLLKAVP
jgi:tetratricopeptide (TPR) repeat protein